NFHSFLIGAKSEMGMEGNGNKSGKHVKSFFRSGQFFRHLALAFVFTIILFIGLILFLKAYTRHGNETALPDFRGMTLAEADSIGYTRQYDFFVIDSVFNDEIKKGAILMQEPGPGSNVKKGRDIYVTTVAIMPEKVAMPDLIFLTLRQALNLLVTNKLRAGHLIYRPSFDHNAVLQQMYEGDTIVPGTLINTGSGIDLVLGSGEIIRKAKIPFLIGKTADEARFTSNLASLNIGQELFPEPDTAGVMRVYRQQPSWNSQSNYYPGDSVHLWYRSDATFNFKEYLKQFSADTLNTDHMVTKTGEE
ncbi:MAG: PASTA domain-containing protein, partial [Bacteroidales bacterium]|nr:PASTA domain-containing protein [Bacteroidales bacterium]